MKGIAITPEGKISIQDFDEPLYVTVGAVVGGNIEHVLPARLPRPFCMIVNEDGIYKRLPVNLVGSYLYGTDEHGIPILGTIVIMQDGRNHGEPDIVGLPDDEVDQIYIDYINRFGLSKEEEN